MLVLSLLLKAFVFPESMFKMVYNKEYRCCSWIICITDTFRLFHFDFSPRAIHDIDTQVFSVNFNVMVVDTNG